MDFLLKKHIRDYFETDTLYMCSTRLILLRFNFFYKRVLHSFSAIFLHNLLVQMLVILREMFITLPASFWDFM